MCEKTADRAEACTARIVRFPNLLPLMHHASQLRGLILALDEIGLAECGSDDLARAASALIIEARSHATQLEDAFKAMRDA